MNKTTATVMPGIYILGITFFSIFHFNCSFFNRERDKVKLTSVALHLEMPGLDPDGNLIEIHDTVVYHYYRNSIIQEIPMLNSLYKTTVNRDGDIIKQEFLGSHIQKRYLVYNRGGEKGLLFDSLHSINPRPCEVDSVFSRSWMSGLKPLYKKNRLTDSLVSSVRENGILIDTYKPRVKNDPSWNDSTYYFFRDGFGNVDFSFDEEEEKAKDLKLFRIVIIYNANPDASDAYQKLPKRFVLEMEHHSAKEPGLIMELARRYDSLQKK